MAGSLSKVLFFCFLTGCFLFVLPDSASAQNSITGMIFDQNRRPVPNIHVELLDDLERLIGSRQTKGSGFYAFNSLRRGVYYIKVRVAGTGFKDQRVRIDIGALNAIGGVDVQQVDIFLEVDRRNSDQAATGSVNSVIFAQSVPPQARASFESSINNIEKNKIKEVTADLLNAIRSFPEYHDALLQLSNVYLSQSKFVEAENVLKKTVSVNPKGFDGYSSLGLAQHKLAKRNEAIESFSRAIEIDPSSIQSHLFLGVIRRDIGQYDAAEKNLLKARDLSDNQSSDANWHLALLYYYNLKDQNAAANELNSYLKNLSKDDLKNNVAKVTAVKKLIKQIRSGKS